MVNLTKWNKECDWVAIWIDKGKVISIYGPMSMNEARKWAQMFKAIIAKPVINPEGLETFE